MKNLPASINLQDYTYDLPEDRIAKEPLANRSDSKLLVYKNGEISHSLFNSITDQLPPNSHLVFNDTRVIPARLFFTKETGALIEIFLLEPVAPTNEIASAMLVKKRATWKCLIGNQKKWKDGQQLTKTLTDKTSITANLVDRQNQIVELSWNNDLEFVHVVTAAGQIPLPPYINREVTYEDQERYQTIYSKFEGAVAAPTAGLHFDELVMSKMKQKGITNDYVTLHVSAGTFQPVKTENALDHNMHSEQIVITKEFVQTLIEKENIISVGTTSMRTLESLYWYGVKLMSGKNDFMIEKLYPYQHNSATLPTRKECLEIVLSYMERNSLEKITGNTEIFIVPGYQFKMCDGLITNYHLPGSTLILLVAAFIGDNWREVYKKALANDYRFLSYGDSSLLLP
ncbi:S-adenosylmethionine:tRNA ribosyltransferase-isomerase [Fulvivirga lutea]|uniref:S-adenosylmethionine:tRNA ribosyltransferase-isomerase n=1 Tax=Fulvivirga lutea TaxID=2810512 RepID=A0A974WDR3_9BACT|nr:S-adenosylmethionine:tRNA ribosyltransferase-isomerase [Fulvivirga lutea]QSE96268.1 S-adenosylmethionine:tRNA ribosyltransferase-isomerase [Fulvivirga lutea]